MCRRDFDPPKVIFKLVQTELAATNRIVKYNCLIAWVIITSILKHITAVTLIVSQLALIQ